MPPTNPAYKAQLSLNASQSVSLSPLIHLLIEFLIMTTHRFVDTALSTAKPIKRMAAYSIPSTEKAQKHNTSTTTIVIKFLLYISFILSFGTVLLTTAANPTESTLVIARILGPICFIKYMCITGDVKAYINDTSIGPDNNNIFVYLSINPHSFLGVH